MRKVDEKWLRDNGWMKTVDETEVVESNTLYTTKKRHVVYKYRPNNYTLARIDHTIYTSRFISDNKIRKRSNYYLFYAFNEKSGFHVENKISRRRFKVCQIVSAIDIID